MHEDKMKDSSYEDICELRKRFVTIVKQQLEHGVSSVDAKEMGEVIDMVKDLAEAEKYGSEACYYDSIVKAMKESEKDKEKYGFVRMKKMMPDPIYPDMADDERYRTPDPLVRSMRMGYPRIPVNAPVDDRMTRTRDWDDRYGRAYNEFRKARKHYTETKSMSDKQEMDEHATEHLTDSMQTIREIWEMADPTLRKKMKTDLQKFSNDLPV